MAIAMAAAASSFGRQGSMAPEDSNAMTAEEETAFLAAAGTKGVKLRRKPGAPTDVYSWFEITLQDANVPSQTFACSVEIHLFWQDYNLPNLIPKWETEGIEIHYDTLPIKMSEIFENKTDCSNSPPEYKYFPQTGTLYMKLVVDCTFAERMELQRFPLDRQFMNMEFNAMIDPIIEDEGKWNWILEFPEWMPDELKFFDRKFAVRMLSSVTEYELLEPWVDFSGEQPLSIRLRVNRLPAFYFGNIILPNFLIVAGCFSTFSIPAEEIADRLSVTVTLMLAAVAFRFIVSTMLPKVSYLTMMDKYLLLGFVALIVLVFENAFAGIIREEDQDLFDLVFALIFGVMWVGVHIIMFTALVFKEFMRVSWEEMDAIDQAEDEEAEFVFAEKENVLGQEETMIGRQEWEHYKDMGVMQRAQEYAKKNNIKRTGTFHMKLKEERKRKVEDNTVIEEAEPIQKVPSKLEQVASASEDEPAQGMEQKMQDMLALDEQQDKDPGLVPQPSSEEEPLSTHGDDAPEEDAAGDAGQHEYNETVVVNEDDEAPLNAGGDARQSVVRANQSWE